MLFYMLIHILVIIQGRIQYVAERSGCDSILYMHEIKQFFPGSLMYTAVKIKINRSSFFLASNNSILMFINDFYGLKLNKIKSILILLGCLEILFSFICRLCFAIIFAFTISLIQFCIFNYIILVFAMNPMIIISME